MKLKNLAEAERALKPFIPSVAQFTGRDMTLKRMWPMMKILSEPQKNLKIIHLAGTSGKTSTAYFLTAQLRSAGLKVGLHVSPHIDKVTERFQIDGCPISDELYCAELGEFLDIIYAHKLKPTYFELHSAFAYWFFDRQSVDYAVIETGLGGLHDSTNVAENQNKACVITDIGLDHMQILGNTVEKIAAQKAGIIHAGNAAYMFEQSPKIMEVFKTRCVEVGAELTTTTERQAAQIWGDEFASDLPLYQKRNWLLAYFVCLGIQKRDGFAQPAKNALLETQKIQVPARMDIKKIGNKTLVMDGAHNQQKMETFVKSFKARFPDQKATVLLSLKYDKNYHQVIDAALPIAGRVIATSFKTTQELPVSSTDPELLAEYCQTVGMQSVTVIKNHHQAYQELLKSSEELLVITGSFYLIYQIRNEENLA